MQQIAFLIALLLALAGCMGAPDQAPASLPTPPEEPAPAPPPEQEEDLPQFCDSQAGCKFWDEDYHEYVLYRVDTYRLDVLIVPPASPFALQDTETMKAAVKGWGEGIKALGEPWFASNFTMEVYVIGQDVPPQEAIEDPEIIVVGAEYNPVLLFGIGLQAPDTPCRGGEAVATYPPHRHDGMAVYTAQCAKGGLTCVALNTNFLLGGSRRMHDLVSHEFGHCLGGGHVGDALDFKAKRAPVEDIMSYQHNATQVHCVSNLNVRVLQGVYAPLLQRPESTWLDPGTWYTMPRGEYVQTTCPNP